MSYLREIMQRLRDRSVASAAPATPSVRSVPALERHLADYAAQLATCTPAMLQYELAWIEQHLDSLELARTNPSMVAAAGGLDHLEQRLEESRRFRDLLDQRFAAEGLLPAAQRHAVLATAHAWELSHPELRRLWGF